MKKLEAVIPENVPFITLKDWLGAAFPELASVGLNAAFRERDVKLNGVRVDSTCMVQPGASVAVYVSEQYLNRVKLLFENEECAVAVKPAGISCDTALPGETPLPKLLERQNGGTYLACHRLDNQTEGLLILAKTESAYLRLVQSFREHRVHKEYLCLVKGSPVPETAVMKAWLLKDAARARVKVVSEPFAQAKEIVTEYKVLNPGEVSLVRVRLHTGRTHQIRAHFAYRGCPLLGDDVYGDRNLNRSFHARRLMLCASFLTFDLEGSLSVLNTKRFEHIPDFFPAPYSSENIRQLVNSR